MTRPEIGSLWVPRRLVRGVNAGKVFRVLRFTSDGRVVFQSADAKYPAFARHVDGFYASYVPFPQERDARNEGGVE